MKVLFAVSNDNITTSVVKKYQQKYKEIITNKNVYYFNAIVKELQKDKTYDSIVIEEDLEPISNNNYEAIDKFLTEKLDSISDEAAKPTGEDIPIIFICADRRTVSDKLLIKLFSMGIYNALVGNDRSLDKLCELIAKPRSKKDAKKYYKIDTDKAEYQSQKDEIVSEDQIQNILNYYKKIGNNERKCVQAFDSISKQYDSTQLRIIVKFLPMDVKAILEARSPVYQRLMSNGTVLSNGQYNAYTPSNPNKPEKLGFISKNLNTNSAKPRSVVIPTNMKVQGREEHLDNSSNNGYTSPYGMNQSYGQYNQNPYGTQNGMGQYGNQYNQMRQNQYGNMYGQMQNNNPYGMGQQINSNRMQQKPEYNNFQSGYGMNNNYQQGMNQQGMNQQGMNQQGMNQQGMNQQGMNQQGMNQQEMNQQGMNQQGMNQQGMNQQGMNQQGMNQQGMNQQGMNQQGMNQQGISQQETQNQFNQMNNNVQQNDFNQNNVNEQQNINQQANNNSTPNIIQSQNENNINQQSYPIEEVAEQSKMNGLQDNNIVEVQQTEGNYGNSQGIDNGSVTTEANSIITQETTKDVNNNGQLINQDNSTDLLKKEENQSLIKNEETDESINSISVEEIKEVANEQEVVEPVKRRRGRPRKIKPSEEEIEVVPTVKRRRGRPRKIAIEDKSDIEKSVVNVENAIEQTQQTQVSQQPIQQEQQNQQIEQQFTQSEPVQAIQNNFEQVYNGNQNQGSSSLPFNTGNEETTIEEEQNNDVSLNSLKSANNNIDNSMNNVNNFNNIPINSMNNTNNYNNLQVNQMEDNQDDDNQEQQLYRKPDEIKPINLYDLDIDSEDMFGDNQKLDLGVKPIDEFKLEEEKQDTPLSQLKQNDNPAISSYMNENTDLINEQRKNNDYDISSPIAGNGKIVAFVGTSKNGTSFIVNNVALLLADGGIKTAVVDLTKNKNSYYMFTDNDAKKTKIATESLGKLSEGIVEGLNVKNNLTIFTSLPENHDEDNMNPRTVLESLCNRFDVVLLDCDFKTHEAYFAFSNEIFLTQSMDAFTIQPLTKFLSDLKLKNILDENKLRIVINKYVKLKKLDAKMIVGGMSKYNEPSMTLQRDLFDPKKIKVITLPFDNQTYTKYLESIALCQVSINGYSKDVVEGLEKIKNLVYPLVAGNSGGYVNNNNYTNINNMDYNNQGNSQGFSNNMNDTLNKMRSNNY